jgi:hypothetical protein
MVSPVEPRVQRPLRLLSSAQRPLRSSFDKIDDKNH